MQEGGQRAARCRFALRTHIEEGLPGVVAEWSDHNVSDPGITLIEAYAQMVDQLIYRLNRVPDRNYVKFLELMDVQLRPPAAARGEVTFWLSAPQPQTVVVRAAISVTSSPRSGVAPSAWTSAGRCAFRGHCAAMRVIGKPARRTSSAGTLTTRC